MKKDGRRKNSKTEENGSYTQLRLALETGEEKEQKIGLDWIGFNFD